MEFLRKITKGILLSFLILIIILLSPLIIPFIITFYFRDKKINKKYTEYLVSINEVNFFCYNNKKNSQEFIEKNILPFLSSEISVIFLDGKTPKSDYEEKYISKLLYTIKEKTGFPYLLKVSKGELLLETSINADFYNTLNQSKDLSPLINKINSFFKVA